MTTLNWEIPVPLNNLPIILHADGNYRKFGFEIHMEVSGASLDLKIVAGGKVLGSKTLQVKTD